MCVSTFLLSKANRGISTCFALTAGGAIAALTRVAADGVQARAAVETGIVTDVR